MIKLIIFILLMIGNVYADNGQVSPIAGLDQKNTSVVNNNFQQIQASLNGTLGFFSKYFTNSILNIANGGTGKDFSAIPANNIPYFSSKGVMGNIGIGTTGQYLTFPPAWTTLTIPVQTKVIYANNVNIGCPNSNSSCNQNVVISSSGDWTSKNYLFFGVGKYDNSATSTSESNTIIIKNTSTTALTGMIFNGTNPTEHTFLYTNLSNIDSGACNNGGNCSCDISISSGNLILSATKSGGVNTTGMACAITGMFIREP